MKVFFFELFLRSNYLMKQYLSCTASFDVFAFIEFYSDFWFYYYYYYITYILVFTTCVLLHWSPIISILYTACLMPDFTLEPLYLTFWLVYSWFIRILSYRIIFWWFILYSLVVTVDSSSCAYSIDGDMRYMVYRWEFSCLDYPLEISISWIYLLSPYNWFCHFCTSHYLLPLLCSCVLVLMTQFSIHPLWFEFIDTCVPIYASHLAFIIPLVG